MMQSECRFGWRCTRPNCFYQHPHGRQIDTQSSTAVSGVLCRFGSRCSKPGCPFVHPGTSAVSTTSSQTRLSHEAAPFQPVLAATTGFGSTATTRTSPAPVNRQTPTGQDSSTSSGPCASSDQQEDGCWYEAEADWPVDDEDDSADGWDWHGSQKEQGCDLGVPGPKCSAAQAASWCDWSQQQQQPWSDDKWGSTVPHQDQHTLVVAAGVGPALLEQLR